MMCFFLLSCACVGSFAVMKTQRLQERLADMWMLRTTEVSSGRTITEKLIRS
jgi:hypothetical protein